MKDKGVIIVAGGSGTRMGAGIPKQFLPLGGKEILVHTVERFLSAVPDAEVVIVLPESEQARWREIASEYGLADACKICTGGADRYSSVKNGLAALGECRTVAVHDGVRPLVSARLILDCFELAAAKGSAIPVVKLVDSFRVFESAGEETAPESRSMVADRNLLRAVQTPQVFRADELREAYAGGYDASFTDDATVFEKHGGQLHFCPGERTNIKITSPEDITMAEAILATLTAP